MLHHQRASSGSYAINMEKEGLRKMQFSCYNLMKDLFFKGVSLRYCLSFKLPREEALK